MEFWPDFLAENTGQEFVAGGVGGIAGVVAGHPLDTLRIRLQQPVAKPGAPAITASALLRQIVATEGPLALYKGMSSPVTTIAFQNAVSFQTYALCSRMLQRRDKEETLSYKNVAMAGVCAGTLQTLILSPVDLIKIRLQLMTDRVSRSRAVRPVGPRDIVLGILRKDGIRGLYRGLTITVIRDAPSHAVYFGTYEYAREWLHPGCRRTGDETLLTMLTAGGLAGAASWMGCYPLDVVKSRLQGQAPDETPRYKGIVDCLRKSVQEEGPKVLWRGIGTTVTRAYLVNGAIFSAYEMTLRFMNPRPPGNFGLNSPIDISA